MNHQKHFHGQEKAELQAKIKEKTGYLIKSSLILSQAFRRRSFCSEYGGKSNEIFEYVGDEVLSFYVVKLISARCSSLNIEGDYSFRIRENHFSSLKQDFVNNESLAKIIDDWGIADYLMVGLSDEKNEIMNYTKTKADLFEAVIGAIAFDSGWAPDVLETVVSNALGVEAKLQKMISKDDYSACFNIDNSIITLKELAEKELCSPPTYELDGPDSFGFDECGKPIWMCKCSIINDKTGITRLVKAFSKKDAKKAAAYLVLCEHFQVQNQYGPTCFYKIWTYKNGCLVPDYPMKLHADHPSPAVDEA